MLPDGNLAGLAKSLRLHSPAVLHITGHGRQDGSLVLRDEQGQAYPMSPQGLAGLIAVHKETLQLVVLNACYSRALAQMVARDIACVVGMTSEIDDDAAILFSDLFYDALFDGASVAQSFKTGVAGLSARHTAEAEHPRLETREGIDPGRSLHRLRTRRTIIVRQPSCLHRRRELERPEHGHRTMGTLCPVALASQGRTT